MSSPTRLPYGLSFVKPNLMTVQTGQYIIGTSATPDVTIGTYFIANASNTTITNFVGGERGKLLYIECLTGGVVVIQNSAGGIRIPNLAIATSGVSGMLVTTAGNVTMLNGETLGFIHNGTDWSVIGNRVILSTQV